MKYSAYLKSEHWTKLRQAAINANGRKCVACGCTQGLEAHHIFYRERWADAMPTDLAALCGACHSIAHFQVKWGDSEQDGREKLKSLIGMIQARRRFREHTPEQPIAKTAKQRKKDAIAEAADHGLNIRK